MSTSTVLRIDASARTQGSVTRSLADHLLDALNPSSTSVITRDLYAQTPSLVSEAWVGANFTAPEQRSSEQRAVLAESDALVDELISADLLLLGVPVYNFGVPAALKAWIDMVARVHRTFRYTAQGPVGLLNGKHAIVIMASGGTALGAEIDFASGYLRHVLGFMGLTAVTFVDATKANEATIAAAQHALTQLASGLPARAA